VTPKESASSAERESTVRMSRMRRPEFIARQSGCPSGILGRVIGRVMAVETAAANECALQLLRLEPTDRVLEVGFGHGCTIERAADRLPHGFIAGVDISEQMVRTASHRNRHHITAGRVALELSDGSPLPFQDGSFDKAFAVHVLYFWPEPLDQLREIRRVLKPGGCCVLGVRVRSDKRTADFPRSVYRFYDVSEVEALLARSGFREIAFEISLDRTVFISGIR
jgi:SAM-dependent methyltransferase